MFFEIKYLDAISLMLQETISISLPLLHIRQLSLSIFAFKTVFSMTLIAIKVDAFPLSDKTLSSSLTKQLKSV